MSWCKHHYYLSPSDFLVVLERLDSEDQETLRMLGELASKVPKGLINTRALVTVEGLINIRALVTGESVGDFQQA